MRCTTTRAVSHPSWTSGGSPSAAGRTIVSMKKMLKGEGKLKIRYILIESEGTWGADPVEGDNDRDGSDDEARQARWKKAGSAAPAGSSGKQHTVEVTEVLDNQRWCKCPFESVVRRV